MEARQRRRVENAQLLERLRHQICPHFNQGQDKETCSRGSTKKCLLDLQHICAACACPGHGAHRCRDTIRDDSSPNPDNVIIRHVDPREAQLAGTAPEVFVTSPACHTAQAAIRRDHRRHRDAGRVFHVTWDHSEQLSARYKQYRQKGRDTKNKEKKDIWPDDIEEAFQIGLRCYARRGRKKEELHGKQCGGNEFISDWIWAATSVWRDRKQVSSHIQVLKGYMMNNPRWLDLLKGDPKWKKFGKVAGSQRPTSPDQHHSVPAQLGMNTPYGFYPAQAPPILDILPSNMPQGPSIRSVKFDMTRCFVQPKTSPSSPQAGPGIHHRYTSIQSEMGSAPRPLDSISQWRTKYPHLNLQDDKGAMSPIFLFESSLNLTENDPKEKTSISVTFEVDFAQAACYRDWMQRTYVQDNTGHTDFLEKELVPANNVDNQEHVYPRIGTDQSLTLPLHFRASYWAQTISLMLGRRQAASVGSTAEVRRDEEQTRQFVNSISLMQELWATPLAHGAEPRRMAVLLWKFQQTHGNETPTTSWRRLTTPILPYRAPSPSAAHLPMPINLAGSLHTDLGSAQGVGQPYSGTQYMSNASFAPIGEPSMVAAQPMASNTNSPDSVPTLADDRSFPSATSISFPPSVSSSGFPPGPGHQGPYDANLANYSRFGSFASQGSSYPPDCHGVGYGVHDMPAGPPDSVRYDGPGALFDPQAHDQPYHHDLAECPPFDAEYIAHPLDPPTLVEPSQSYDCNGMRLPYDAQGPLPGQSQTPIERDESQQYDAPLAAPRAHMISQHQILQLDHYDNLQQNASPSVPPGREAYNATKQASQGPERNGDRPGQPDLYGNVPRQWPVTAQSWQQPSQSYANSPYTAAEPSQEDLDNWYDDSARRTLSFLEPSPQDRRFRPVAGYPSPAVQEPPSRIVGGLDETNTLRSFEQSQV